MSFYKQLRLFIAVPLPNILKEHLESLLSSMDKTFHGIKKTSPENIHLTLKFIGSTSENKIPAITEVMQSTFRVVNTLTLSTDKIGCFPNIHRPSILWLGIRDPAGEINGWVRSLNKDLRSIGIPEEARDFHAHITLGRIKKKPHSSFAGWMTGVKKNSISVSFLADQIVLFESKLTREGPCHQPVFRINLKTT